MTLITYLPATIIVTISGDREIVQQVGHFALHAAAQFNPRYPI